jgi:hypothetical protein
MSKKKIIAIIALFLVAAVLIAVIASSVRLPTSCSQLSEPKLGNIPTNLSAQAMQTWVEKRFRLSTDEIHILPDYPSSATDSVRWKWRDKSYEIFIDNQTEQLIFVEIDWGQHRPYLGEILNCFGSPRYYAATKVLSSPPYQYNLSVWYPETGFMAEGVQLSDDPNFTTQFEMNKIRLFMIPLSIQDMATLGPGILSVHNGFDSLQDWTGIEEVTPIDLTE